jgi:hypothetical protein
MLSFNNEIERIALHFIATVELLDSTTETENEYVYSLASKSCRERERETQRERLLDR